MLGFTKVAKHRSKDVTLYRQGDINFILNNEPAAAPASLKSWPGVRHGFPVKAASLHPRH